MQVMTLKWAKTFINNQNHQTTHKSSQIFQIHGNAANMQVMALKVMKTSKSNPNHQNISNPHQSKEIQQECR
jgi:hypothetical protein